ncbi:patatin-like phospholipase domain-containing protein [Ditylenchus destructor]|nr:patatin-like phospholipase domain-containing protein [Ditylenchus destructor]
MQLLTAVKQENIGEIVRLYSRGALGNVQDGQGNNLLHIAVKKGNLQVVQAVLLFYGRHYSLCSKRNRDGKLPEELSYSIEIRSCIEVVEKGRQANDNTKKNGDSAQNVSHSSRNAMQDIDNQINKQNIDAMLKRKDKLAILLSLDGGGIRGLILIRILIYLEWKLGSSFWEKVDWVAGTSTGAILALGLGKKHSPEHIERAYLRLKNDVFVGRRPYNPKTFERFLKDELGSDTMGSIKHPKIVVTTCLTHVAPPRLKLFRNYKPNINDEDCKRFKYEEPSHVPLWRAARCSSAAPTYFPPFEDIYSDGGIMANNPTMELLTEFFRYKSIEICTHSGKPMDENLGCVVSLGTGVVPAIKITASDGIPVDQSRAWCMSLDVPFFRFSPPLRDAIELNERDDKCLINMLWDAELYMASAKCADQVDELIDFLKRIKPIEKKHLFETQVNKITK